MHFLCFSHFLSSRRTSWQPYRLSHIDALHINLSYWPKDQSLKFSQKKIEIWRFWKTLFLFESALWTLFFKKNIFCLISMKVHQRSLDIKDGTIFGWLPWFLAKNHPPQTFQPPVYYVSLFPPCFESSRCAWRISFNTWVTYLKLRRK